MLGHCRYGSDKPDLRFEMELADLSGELKVPISRRLTTR
jgi:aspartyl-tRNA synthetase